MRSLRALCPPALLTIAIASNFAVPACANRADDCAYNSNCSSGTGGGGAAGNVGGRSGAGGGDAGGGGSDAGGPAGGGSSGAGEAGASGGGSTPCDGSCTGSKSVCDGSTNTCVECLNKGDCAVSEPACDTTTKTCVECVDRSTCVGLKPACDVTTNTCVECTDTADCKSSTKPFCDVTESHCVACLKQADCISPTASVCSAGACVACTQDADCSNIAGKGVCDAGTCVQCTGKNYGACGSSVGTPLVCDSLLHTCTANKQGSAGLCQSCVSDAQCTAGKMCVQEQFGSPVQPVGYFCFWKKGDTANGAPTTCLPGANPYSATLANTVSIDGTKADICSLAVSTCIARNQFKNKSCASPTLPDDLLCGFAPTKDSKCAQADIDVFRCTMTCSSDDDCPGTACDTGVAPAVCRFQ